jgi:hypothetical protein
LPTNRTKRARTRANAIDHWKLDQLFHGTALISGAGYAEGLANGCNHWTPAERLEFERRMKADWQLHGRDVLAWWRGAHNRYGARFDLQAYLDRHGQTEPWAFRQWGEPQ